MIAEHETAPSRLSLPTFEDRLRVIGRRLDLAGYRSVSVTEIAGGFLIRGMLPGRRVPEALELPHADFPDLIEEAIRGRGEGPRVDTNHPLLPTGYEDFLRALGYRLDTQHAEAIAITELGSLVAVNGVVPVGTYHETTMTPLQIILRPDDINTLIDEGYRRRNTVVEPSRRARIFGR